MPRRLRSFMNKKRANSLISRYDVIIITILAALAALFLGAFIIFSQGRNPVDAYKALFQGAFGSIPSIGTTISRTVPLIFTGLAVAVAYKSVCSTLAAKASSCLAVFAQRQLALLLQTYLHGCTYLYASWQQQLAGLHGLFFQVI